MYERRKQKGIHHVCLRVPDLHETMRFYRDALDAEIICEWGAEGKEDHAFIMDIGHGDFLEIFGSKERYGIGSWQHVALWTDDIDSSMAKAVAYGAKHLSGPGRSNIPTRSGQTVRMKFGFVRAPGGETIEFIQDVPEE
ncbi:MAG: VOC family protein [Oscillospiraceae bacterium]|jgi:catechol 2,3-dioxygenase-like lactoylglutathione lyase family enzyme|nr:VOC family protein [Oscillospiraceae bacterium]